MMKLKSLLFIPFVLFLFSEAIAQTSPYPSKFGTSVEWLYMLPGIDQPYYAVSYEAADYMSAGERISADQRWQSGYRIDFIYSLCDCLSDIRVRWTHFPSFSNSNKIEGFLVPIFPFTGATVQSYSNLGTLFASDANFHNTLHFYYLDFLLGRKAIDYNCFTLDIQGGIQYGYLSHKEQTFFLFPLPITTIPQMISIDKAKSRLWGIGPEFSTELSYLLRNCISLTGRGCGALLISKKEVDRKTFVDNITSSPMLADDPDESYSIKDKKYWKVIPTLDFRFGCSFFRSFDSCFCAGPFTIDLEIGYEAVWFFHAIERIYNMIDQSTLTPINFGVNFDQLITFVVHGPYVHLGIVF